ncbi:MAG: FAD-binding oxidoreductase [bacterium]|nr:FAD-binding oxidoreductase [bacterium]
MPMLSHDSPVTFRDPLPQRVDVVVIGGGIAGIASAWFLAERGDRVLVVEKGRIAGEQSSRNWGWVRQQGRDAAELPIMMESNRIWRGLAAATGSGDLAFTQSACVKLVENEEAVGGMEAWHAIAREHQLDTVLLGAGEVENRFAAMGGSFVGGMMTASDGRAEPERAVPAWARALKDRGVTVIEECAARLPDIEGGRITGVITEKGRVACDRLLLAGGAWSSGFAANCGIDLAQLVVRSTAARTHPSDDILPLNMSVPGLATRRRADGGYTVSTGDVAEHYVGPPSFRHAVRFVPLLRKSARDVRLRPAAPAGFPGSWGLTRRWSADEESPYERQRVLNPPPSPLVIRRLEERLPRRAPALARAGLAEAWAGMIDVTPDAVPMLGELPIPGLFVATGFSGHGFGIGPAIGRIMADLVTGRSPGHDLQRFRPGRFADGTRIVPGPY